MPPRVRVPILGLDRTVGAAVPRAWATNAVCVNRNEEKAGNRGKRMALGMVEGCQCKRRCCVGEVSKYGQYTRIIGRKRVVTPQSADDLPFSSPISTPFKRRPKKKSHEAVNRLEMLPQDVLMHVGV
ncbi:hypothetical protein Taro_050428 [Colocasia esculenta]|uniref:Uncharacterized protein n=1 Tax=Colocasia esculenta TaxID=4460 RepID=A0A843XDP9_COLES|nr:hypothetical protein [Colocasia esculenta]